MSETPQLPKTLTASEANELLPKVKLLVERLQGLQHSIIQTNHQLDEAVRKLAQGNGYPVQAVREEVRQLTAQQLKLIETFQSALKELEGLGAQVKDVTKGLIDFYSLRNDELVFLCWKLGEEHIQFWHTLEAGFAGRQLLDWPA